MDNNSPSTNRHRGQPAKKERKKKTISKVQLNNTVSRGGISGGIHLGFRFQSHWFHSAAVHQRSRQTPQSRRANWFSFVVACYFPLLGWGHFCIHYDDMLSSKATLPSELNKLFGGWYFKRDFQVFCMLKFKKRNTFIEVVFKYLIFHIKCLTLSKCYSPLVMIAVLGGTLAIYRQIYVMFGDGCSCWHWWW